MKRAVPFALVVLIASSLCVFVSNVSPQSFDQYSHLSQSFIDGHLYFTAPYTTNMGQWQDATPHDGHYYWPLGLLPAVLLVPLELEARVLGSGNTQGTLDVLFYCIALFAVYAIARNLRYTPQDRLWWSVAFCAGTMFLGAAAISRSWNIGDTVATVFVLLSLAEYTGKKRYWLVGTCMALAFLTRSTIAPGIFFFVWEIWSGSKQVRDKARDAAALLLPFSAGICVYFAYNFLRFGSIFDNGYPQALILEQSVAVLRAQGLFGIVHVPFNLYYMFLAPPIITSTSPFIQLNGWGMSVFVTSLWMFWIFSTRGVFRKYISLWVTAAVILIPILLYYGNGYWQYGSRYALDFLPFVFLAFLCAYRDNRETISRWLKVAIIASVTLDIYMLSPSVCFYLFLPIVIIYAYYRVMFPRRLRTGTKNLLD